MGVLEDMGFTERVGERVRFNPVPDRGTRARLGLGTPPQPLETGWSPFGPATAIAATAVDWATLASSLFVAPVPSTRFYPAKGSAASLPLSDHDHGVDKGPPDVVLAIGYAAPGQPNTVARVDTPGGAVMSAVINYAGPQVASVVVTRAGYTITATPSYTGADITSVHRVRT